MKRKYQDYMYFQNRDVNSTYDDYIQKFQDSFNSQTTEAGKNYIKGLIDNLNTKKELTSIFNEYFDHDASGVIIEPTKEWFLAHFDKMSSDDLLKTYKGFINDMITLGISKDTVYELTKWTEGYAKAAIRAFKGTKFINKGDLNWKQIDDQFNSELDKLAPYVASGDYTQDEKAINSIFNDVKSLWEGKFDNTYTKEDWDDKRNKEKQKNNPNNNQENDPLNDFMKGFWNGFSHVPGILGQIITGGDVYEYIKNINDPNSDDAKDPFGLGKFFGSIFDSVSKIFGGAFNIDTTMVKWVFIGVVSYVIYREIKPYLKSD